MVAPNATGGLGSGSFNPRPVTCVFRALQQSSATWLTLCFFPLLLDLETEDAVDPEDAIVHTCHLPGLAFGSYVSVFVDLSGL